MPHGRMLTSFANVFLHSNLEDKADSKRVGMLDSLSNRATNKARQYTQHTWKVNVVEIFPNIHLPQQKGPINSFSMYISTSYIIYVRPPSSTKRIITEVIISVLFSLVLKLPCDAYHIANSTAHTYHVITSMKFFLYVSV